MKKTKANKNTRSMRGVSDQQIATAIAECFRRLDALANHLAWCMVQLKHPEMTAAVEAAKQKDTGLVTPPAAGEIVITG